MARTLNRPCARPGCTNHATPQPRHRGLCHKHTIAAGLLDTRVPADRARTHLNRVMAQGATITGIHAATGVPLASIARIADGTYRQARKSTERALLTATPDMAVMIPATGSIRRLRALRAQGWNAKTELPAALGVSFQTITNLTNDPEPGRRIHADLATKIREFADAHPEVIRPPSSWVARRGWRTLWDWDDIDAPICGNDRVEVTATIRQDIGTLHEVLGTWGAVSAALGLTRNVPQDIYRGHQKSITVDLRQRIAEEVRQSDVSLAA